MEDDNNAAAVASFQAAISNLTPKQKAAFEVASAALEQITIKAGGKVTIDQVQQRILATRATILEHANVRHIGAMRQITERIDQLENQVQDLEFKGNASASREQAVASKVSMLEDRYEQVQRDMLGLRREMGLEENGTLGAPMIPPKEMDKPRTPAGTRNEDYCMPIPDMSVDVASQAPLRMHLKAPNVRPRDLPGLVKAMTATPLPEHLQSNDNGVNGVNGNGMVHLQNGGPPA